MTAPGVSFLSCLALLPLALAAAPRANLTVAADGTGQFTNVQAAVDAAPTNSPTRFIIHLKPGVYREKIVVPPAKSRLSFIGDDALTTVLSFDLNANLRGTNGQPIGTFKTPSTLVQATDFRAENITFENSAGPVGQALAIAVSGDRAAFRNCRFLGWQDTVLAQSGRQYFERCYLSGHVDFIFGGATAYFESCEIHCRTNGYITAAATPEQQPYGYVFSHCRITSELPGLKTYLGRPWRPFASVAFLNTEMSAGVRPEGWNNWRDPAREKTARYAEFNSTGPGARPESRVPWARTLAPNEANKLTAKAVLGGLDGWNPKTGKVSRPFTVTPDSGASKTAKTRDSDSDAFLFSSFRGNGLDGIKLAYSLDGYHWTNLDRTFFKPEAGQARILRDPSLCQGPDGTFHLVWTTGWRVERGFGYASSKDLIQWSEQQFIPVMAHEPTVANVWAPELFYDDSARQFLIIWASTVPDRFPDFLETRTNNHRLYYTATADFKTFSPARVFFDPGYSAIDGFLVKDGARYVLVHKDNSRPELCLRVAFADHPLGPWSAGSDALTANRTEGPAALKIGPDWLIYFDWYGAGRYGALRTRDFRSFQDITSQVSLPEGHKHGTALRVQREVLERLIAGN